MTSAQIGEASEPEPAKECVRRGQRKAYRPVPRDFVERWPAVGWQDAKEEWGASSGMVARWLDQCGREGLDQARREWRRKTREMRS